MNDELVERLRDAFQRVRYGGNGPYIPDGDLFDVAADRIEALTAQLAEARENERAAKEVPLPSKPKGRWAWCPIAGEETWREG